MEGGEGLFAAQCDALEVIELVEEEFDEVPFAVEGMVNGLLAGEGRVRGYRQNGAEIIGDEVTQDNSIVSGVGNDMAHSLEPHQQGLGLGAVAALGRGNGYRDRSLDTRLSGKN